MAAAAYLRPWMLTTLEKTQYGKLWFEPKQLRTPTSDKIDYYLYRDFVNVNLQMPCLTFLDAQISNSCLRKIKHIF